jgi:hypothetical protein
VGLATLFFFFGPMSLVVGGEIKLLIEILAKSANRTKLDWNNYFST